MDRKVKLSHSQTDFKGDWKLSDIFTCFAEIATTHAMSFGGWDPKYQNQYGWIISKMRIKVYNVVRIGQEATIRTWVTEGTHVVYPRHFEIYNDQGELMAEATSNWTLLDLVRRRIAMPKRVGLSFPDNLPKKGNIEVETDFMDEDGFEFVEDRAVRFSDLDVNGHLNNARYVDWMCDVLGYDAFNEGYICDLSIQFKKETAPHGVLRLEKKIEGDSFKVRGVSGSDVHFVAEGLWKKY